jgi:hypothetical protein
MATNLVEVEDEIQLTDLSCSHHKKFSYDATKPSTCLHEKTTIHSILKSLCPLEDQTEPEENGTHELQLHDAHFIYFLDID